MAECFRCAVLEENMRPTLRYTLAAATPPATNPPSTTAAPAP